VPPELEPDIGFCGEFAQDFADKYPLITTIGSHTCHIPKFVITVFCGVITNATLRWIYLSTCEMVFRKN
jgi:hypothetical protein